MKNKIIKIYYNVYERVDELKPEWSSTPQNSNVISSIIEEFETLEGDYSIEYILKKFETRLLRMVMKIMSIYDLDELLKKIPIEMLLQIIKSNYKSDYKFIKSMKKNRFKH